MCNNKVKRFLALMLTVAMGVSLVACGSEEKQESTKKESKVEEKQDDAEELEPITITWGYVSGALAAGDGIHTDKTAALQYIKDKFNIEIEWKAFDESKFNLWVAGDDLPDVLFNEGYGNTTQELIESGKYLDMTDLIEEYGSHIKTNIQAALDLQQQKHGGIYYIPLAASNPDAPVSNLGIGFRYRYDIYKAIGSPEITDEDSLIEVLADMQAYQREQTGDDGIYVYSFWQGSGDWPYIIPYPYAHGWQDEYNNHIMNNYTGEMQDCYLDEDGVFWKGIEFFNKAYNAGIFDPDSFVQDETIYADKVQSGKSLCDINGNNPNIELCGEYAFMAPLPTKEEGLSIQQPLGSYSPTGWGSSGAKVITSNCEYPERVMQLFDWLDSPDGGRTLLYGPQGAGGWDIIDGVPRLTEAAVQAYADGTTSDFFAEISMRNFCEFYLWHGAVKSDDGAPTKLHTNADFRTRNATVANKSFAQDFGCNYAGEVYVKWVEEGMYGDNYPTMDDRWLFTTINVPAEITEELAEAENYFCANVSKVIMAANADEFAKEKQAIIDYLVDMGYDETSAGLLQIIEDYRNSLD